MPYQLAVRVELKVPQLSEGVSCTLQTGRQWKPGPLFQAVGLLLVERPEGSEWPQHNAMACMTRAVAACMLDHCASYVAMKTPASKAGAGRNA
jgi:hypothetical protein